MTNLHSITRDLNPHSVSPSKPLLYKRNFSANFSDQPQAQLRTFHTKPAVSFPVLKYNFAHASSLKLFMTHVKSSTNSAFPLKFFTDN